MDKRESKKRLIVSLICIILLIVIVIGVTYAMFNYSKLGSKINSITSGSITLLYEEGNEFKVENASPVTDTLGKIGTDKFTFTVSANIVGKTTISYDIAAVKDASSTLKNEYIKLYLTEGTPEVEKFVPSAYVPISSVSANGAPAGSMVLLTDQFASTGNLSETRTYTFRMWVSDNISASEMQTVKSFKVRIGVYAKQLLG